MTDTVKLVNARRRVSVGKYIDSEAFFKVINTLPYKDTSYPDASSYNGAISDVADMLTHFPAADVAEVRHGRWVRGDEMSDYPRVPYNPWETYCSCCGEIMEQSHDNFCGNCGAKMAGVLENG